MICLSLLKWRAEDTAEEQSISSVAGILGLHFVDLSTKTFASSSRITFWSDIWPGCQYKVQIVEAL
jgi:hypothetical protein